jgi:hypothetical protein
LSTLLAGPAICYLIPVRTSWAAAPGKSSGQKEASGAFNIRLTGAFAERRRAVQGRDGEMYRSVIESQQEGSEKRRLWRWGEGIAVALVVVVGVTYLFGLITF